MREGLGWLAYYLVGLVLTLEGFLEVEVQERGRHSEESDLGVGRGRAGQALEDGGEVKGGF